MTFPQDANETKLDGGEASQTWNWKDWKLEVELCHHLTDIGESTEDNKSYLKLARRCAVDGRNAWSAFQLNQQHPRAACLKLFDRWIIFLCVLHTHVTSSYCTPSTSKIG